MTPEYILEKSLCRPPHCGDSNPEVNKRRAESEIECLGWSHTYAEPGYDAPSKGVLFANWNYFPSDIDTLLEHYGYAIEWSDEWSTCSNCNAAFRVSGDSYHWLPAYVEQDSELLCLDCVDWPDYLESIEDCPRKAAMREVNPADHGYTLLSEPSQYENGFYPGQNDNPAAILKQLHAEGKRNILFRISGKGQFDLSFEVWQRSEVQ